MGSVEIIISAIKLKHVIPSMNYAEKYPTIALAKNIILNLMNCTLRILIVRDS